MRGGWIFASLVVCTVTFDAAAQTLPPAAPGLPQPAVGGPAPLLPSDHVFPTRPSEGVLADAKAVDIGGGVRLSVSTLAHVEAEGFDDQAFGRTPGEDPFWNRRVNVYADLIVGERLRVFGALKHGWRDGSEAFVPPIERDEGDLHQLFAEARLGDLIGGATDDVLVRIGRQELHYGAGRLISQREGPNVRDDFDAVVLRVRRGGAVVDLLAAYDVTDEEGAFDNHTDEGRSLWGGYGTTPIVGRHQLDLYYVGTTDDRTILLGGPADERRHSLGARWWLAPGGVWSGDLEVTGQWGEADAADGQRFDVGGWSVSGSLGRAWRDAPGSPALTSTFGVTSGDEEGGTVTTFRAPRPPGRYFGETTPFGPGNLAGASADLTFSPSKKLTIGPGAILFWRLSDEDGTFTPGGTLALGADGDEHFAGWEAGVGGSYAVAPGTSVNFSLNRFEPGAYVEENSPGEPVWRAFLQLSARL